MLFEGELSRRARGVPRKGGKRALSSRIFRIKIETDRFEYVIDLSYRKKYVFFVLLFLLFSFFLYDWLSLRFREIRGESSYGSLFGGSAISGQVLAELRREVWKLKELNRSLLVLVGGEGEFDGAVLQEGDGRVGDQVLRDIRMISSSLRMVREELSREMEIFEHLPTLWPVRGRITSGFGSRVNPVTGEYHFHGAVDISAPPGTPVVAAASGKVVEIGRNPLNGLYLRIKHINGISTTYAHLSSVSVSKGRYVRKGEVIGFVGSSGRTTGNHLHFEISYRGRPVDPLMFLIQE